MNLINKDKVPCLISSDNLIFVDIGKTVVKLRSVYRNTLIVMINLFILCISIRNGKFT